MRILYTLKHTTERMSNLKFSKQMSESIKLGVILAIAGGFMDAYSYMCRGKVFANAQTGNILLLGINISERNWHMALHYLVPVSYTHLIRFAMLCHDIHRNLRQIQIRTNSSCRRNPGLLIDFPHYLS